MSMAYCLVQLVPQHTLIWVGMHQTQTVWFGEFGHASLGLSLDLGNEFDLGLSLVAKLTNSLGLGLVVETMIK